MLALDLERGGELARDTAGLREARRGAYGGSSDIVEALLALDGDIGAAGGLELDLELGWWRALASVFPRDCHAHMDLLTLAGVVEILVDDLGKR